MAEERDNGLFAYADWLNKALFAHPLGAEDRLMWLDTGRFMLSAPEGPDVFLIEIRRAEVIPAVQGEAPSGGSKV